MTEITIEHSPVFTKNHFCEKRVRVNQGSARSTKTFSICQSHITHSLANPKEVQTISRARLTWLKATLIPDYLWILANQFYVFNPDHWNKSESTYYFENGSVTRFIGLDEVQKLHGMKQHRAWVNEAMEATYKDFQQLAFRTTGTITLDFNPSADQHWIYDNVIPRDDCEFIKSTYKDNKFLEQEIIDEIERLEPNDYNIKMGTADRVAWEVYGLGNPAAHKGLIFGDWEIVADLPHPDKWERTWYGQDFGFSNDPTALIQTVLCDGALYHKQLIYKRGLTNIINLKNTSQDSIEGEYQKLFVSKKKPIWCDSAEPKSIQDLINCGYNCRPADKGPDSVLAGIDTLKRYKNFVTEDSMDLIKEKSMYKWKEDKGGAAVNEPIDMWNHGIDALRYSCYMELRMSDKLHKAFNPNATEKLGFKRKTKVSKKESYFA